MSVTGRVKFNNLLVKDFHLASSQKREKKVLSILDLLTHSLLLSVYLKLLDSEELSRTPCWGNTEKV